jgi:catechol-2,3-dioxygenase
MSAQSTNGNDLPISPTRLSHAVLRTTRLKEMVDWYKTVLNAEILYQNDFIVFMTYDDEHHRIALASFPGVVEKPKHSAGLDHLAFFYANLSDWISTYERLKGLGILPKVSIHHGVTLSLYYRDPDDNGVELAIDNVDRPEWHEWMRDKLKDNPIGLPLDPEELARKFHAGVPEPEIRLVSPASAAAPDEMVRRLIE